jgi:hypothetical protein
VSEGSRLGEFGHATLVGCVAHEVTFRGHTIAPCEGAMV